MISVHIPDDEKILFECIYNLLTYSEMQSHSLFAKVQLIWAVQNVMRALYSIMIRSK